MSFNRPCSMVSLGGLLVSVLAGAAEAQVNRSAPIRTAIHRRVLAETTAAPTAGSKDALRPVNPQQLRREPVKVYRLGPGDVLGIQIDGVLGSREEPIPVHFPKNGDAPSMGYPVPVREDGTISLPLVDPIPVAGLSLAEAEAAVRRRFTEETRILNPGQDRILISLMRHRTTEVLVVREDATMGNEGRATELRRGQVVKVWLKPGEDDVLHALAASGGLPGLDAKNQVTILRSSPENAALSPEVVPLRIDPLAPPAAAPPMELKKGDVLHVEARSRDVYYTGGQLPGGEHVLPRDRDLDVLGAVAIAGGVPTGAQQIPPSQVLIIRRMPDGSLLPLKVDLRRAAADPSQRVVIRPGDFVMLRHRPGQPLLNYGLSNLQSYGLLRALAK